MAERRMMAKSVIESDKFMDLPMSTQCLYFHMLLRADDDGFIKNPSAIQRAIGCSSDDMKILTAKQFVLPFESGVIVIRHWKIHNYIQKDRYRPSDCCEAKQIETDASKAYKIKVSKDLYPECIQNVSDLDTECIQSVSIGKDRLGKSIYAAADARTRAREPDSQNRDEKISADEMHAVVSAASKEQAAVPAEEEQAVVPPAEAYAVTPELSAEGDAVPPEMAGSKAENRELGEVVKAFCDNLHPGAGPMALEQVADAYGTYGGEWCLAAIREAAESGGRSIQYVCRILERWRRDGYKVGKGGKSRGNGKAGKHSGTDGGSSRCDDFDAADRRRIYPWDV